MLQEHKTTASSRSGSASENSWPSSGGIRSRLAHAVVGLTYLLSYWNVYVNYLSITWGYTGLSYRPMGAWEVVFAMVGVLSVGYSLPTRLRQPSALVLWLLFIFVYVPTVAQTFMLGERSPIAYAVALGALTIVMIAAAMFSREPKQSTPNGFLPTATFSYGILLGLVVATAAIIYAFRDIMTFANIMSSDDVYATRFAAADRTGGVFAYIRTYHTFFLCPAAIAIGLTVPRLLWFVPLGVAGLIVSYMVDASKISLIIPLSMFAVFAVVRWFRSSCVVMTAAMAAMTFLSSILANHTTVLRFFADLFLFRSIAIPGQQFALYYDLFAARGFTWWSNVRGIGLFVPPPPAFANDLRWPVLGQIVGEEYYGFGSRMNSNANLFAGEGVAAGGAVGVMVIGAVLALFLWTLDRAAAGWSRAYVLLVMAPIGLALTNSHLSTLLLSYGAGLWIVVLSSMGPFPRLLPWHSIPQFAWPREFPAPENPNGGTSASRSPYS